ncbi:hypothetical protein ACOME3_004751 [Neoechinorhynchus agilis]
MEKYIVDEKEQTHIAGMIVYFLKIILCIEPPPPYPATAPGLVPSQSNIPPSNPVLGPILVDITCPHCHQQVITKVEYKTGVITWIVCSVMLVVGFWCGCCLVPFMLDSTKDALHRCPNCNSYIGLYKRL